MKNLSAFQPLPALILLFAMLILSGIAKGANRPYPPCQNAFIVCTSSAKEAAVIGKKRKRSNPNAGQANLSLLALVHLHRR